MRGVRDPTRNEAVQEPVNEGGVSVDPICGKPVVDEDSPAMEYRHRKYFFCSERCRERFELKVERMRVKELARMGALFDGSKVRWGLA